MKRCLALLLAVMMLLALMTACDKEDADSDYTAPTHANNAGTNPTETIGDASDGDGEFVLDTLPASDGDIGEVEDDYPASDGDIA